MNEFENNQSKTNDDVIFKLEREINKLVRHMKAVEQWNNRFGVYSELKTITDKALKNY